MRRRYDPASCGAMGTVGMAERRAPASGAPAWATTGTITFLLTDVQGSTRLWETEPDAMAVALPRHDAIFGEVVGRHGGWIVKSKGEGDSVFCIFDQPLPAVRAAVDLQLALAAERWPTSKPISVRMALHTGDAELREGDWYGTTVNRCARLRATAHGGQVVLSGVVRDAVDERLPDGVSLRDLGVRRLKDLTEPERIFQVLHAQLPEAFPPLLALDARPNNLPLQPTPLVGREHEVTVARSRLRQPEIRLLTVTGPGGVGKSRLALHVAADCIDDFEHGVWFVPLAPVAEPAQVAYAVADALGVPDRPGVSVETALEEHLADRRLLLVLDNFEHVLDAAGLVARLLERCAGVRLLVTSREWLHLRAEHELVLDPLPAGSAVELFAARASAVAPDFRLDDGTAGDVAAICTLLDGLPLAIELVAARLRRFSLDELLGRLRVPLDVASDGPRDLPARQRTLRETIAWSYDLCDDDERALLRRLGAFAGGAPVAALAALAGIATDAVVALAVGLADKSLVGLTGEGDDRRVTVLETIRQFAVEQLAAEGEQAEAVATHAGWYDGFAEVGDVALTGPDQAAWLDRFETEHANLRAVLAREGLDQDLRLRLSGRLARFWLVRGHWTEGREWYERVLRAPGGTDRWRADALLGAGLLADRQGERELARKYLEACLDIRRNLDDSAGIAQVLNVLGEVALAAGAGDEAEERWTEALSRYRALRDQRGQMLVLVSFGRLAHDLLRNYEEARRLWEEALVVADELGEVRAQRVLLTNLGMVARTLGDTDSARELTGRSAALSAQLGDPRGQLVAARTLAQISIEAQDWGGARQRLDEALRMAADLGDRPARVDLLRLSAVAEEHLGHPEVAVDLYLDAARIAGSVAMPDLEAQALGDGAIVAFDCGDRLRAVALLERLRVLEQRLAPAPVLPAILAYMLLDGGEASLVRRLEDGPSDEEIDQAIALVGQPRR
jgi:predicted ATPase/Tfp pilus assembly protein PilF